MSKSSINGSATFFYHSPPRRHLFTSCMRHQGPSFYEDSSRTVFADECCDATLIQQKPNTFFGTWGAYYNRCVSGRGRAGLLALALVCTLPLALKLMLVLQT